MKSVKLGNINISSVSPSQYVTQVAVELYLNSGGFSRRTDELYVELVGQYELSGFKSLQFDVEEQLIAEGFEIIKTYDERPVETLNIP